MNIKSIAKKTGYSESTVSRALNHDSRISEKTTKIIQNMADKLNYQKDFAAMNLNNQESNILGVIFPPEDYMNVNNPFYIEIIKQASYVAAQHHYMISVILAKNPAELGERIDMMIEQGKVRKFVMLYNLKNDPLITKLKQAKVNFVVVGDPRDPEVVFVDNDNFQVGQAVSEQLVTNNPSIRPLFIMSNKRWQFEIARQQGMTKQFQKHSVSLKIFEFNTATAYTAEQFAAVTDDYNTIVVSSDDLLVKLYGLLDYQLRASVISFNNSVFIKPISQQIKSVDLHPHEMGSKAAELLFEPKFNDVPRKNYVGFTI